MKRSLKWCLFLLLTLAMPANALVRDVTITLDSLVVHDDCDNLSEGDWIVAFSGVQSGARSDVKFDVWPSINNAKDVDSGTTVQVSRSFTLPAVPLSNQINVALSAIDCDGNGVSLPGYFLIPGFPIVPEGLPELDRRAIPPWGLPDCSGEEEIIIEQSGNHDNVGSAFVELTATQWNDGGPFLMAPLQSTQCFEGEISFEGMISDPGGFVEPRAYTANISVTSGPVVIDGTIVPIVMMPW